MSEDIRNHEVVAAAVGKRIECARMDGDSLRLAFDDGTTLSFSDEGQSCCEHRYITCDDDLQEYTGARLVGAELGEAKEIDGSGDVHDVQFLRVNTDLGTIVCCTHNEHNGYYGGFAITAFGDSQFQDEPAKPEGPPATLSSTDAIIRAHYGADAVAMRLRSWPNEMVLGNANNDKDET